MSAVSQRGANGDRAIERIRLPHGNDGAMLTSRQSSLAAGSGVTLMGTRWYTL